MRLERLVIDAGGRTLATDFHPRLTVVGGLEPRTRDALVGEIIGSLAGARPGVHLELVAGGASLTVFRPANGRHRVVDTDAVQDVTARFEGPGGDIDLFAALGTSRSIAQETIRLTREDLVLRGESDDWATRLAAIDQDRLWDTATRAQVAEQLLDRVSSSTGTSSDDAALVEQVEERHRELVEATESHDRIRLIALTLGTIGAISGAAAAATGSALVGLAFSLLAVLGVGLAVHSRRNVSRAEEAERHVLQGTGADDYASFHFDRVSALLDNDHERRRFMLAVSDHRRAQAEWTALVGDVPLHFATEHEARIRAAAGLRRGVTSLEVVSTGAPELGANAANELAQAVMARIDALRALSPDDLLPLVVDDPFEGLDPSLKPILLEMLQSQADGPQLIVVTADEDVTAWARLESMTGDVAVVEPVIGQAVAGTPVAG